MTIRRVPEDFHVEERLGEEVARLLTPAPPGAASHAVFRLEKRSLTTPEAIRRLAKVLGVPAGVIDYCGLKDKHAVTIQHVSVPTPKLRPNTPPPPTLEVLGLRADFAGYLPHVLQAANIGANRFTIVVRDLSRQASSAMDAHLAIVRDSPDSAAFINYFGDQRFGSARHGEGFAARFLVRGEFEEALRLLIAVPHRKDSGPRRAFTRLAAARWGEWALLARDLPRCAQRRVVEALASGAHPREAFASLSHAEQVLAVEAYQSHLWNAVARRLAASLDAPGTIKADDPFGEMLFPPARALPGAWGDLEIPTLAPDTELAEPWRAAAEAVLAQERIGLSDLRIPGLRRPAFGRAPRPLVTRATGLSLSPARPDEMSGRLKRALRFALPRGAYATVLLRALGQ